MKKQNGNLLQQAPSIMFQKVEEHGQISIPFFIEHDGGIRVELMKVFYSLTCNSQQRKMK